MKYTIECTKRAAPLGAYIPTAEDARKARADFRLTATFGGKYEITWADGRRETLTRYRFDALAAKHPWVCDF